MKNISGVLLSVALFANMQCLGSEYSDSITQRNEAEQQITKNVAILGATPNDERWQPFFENLINNDYDLTFVDIRADMQQNYKNHCHVYKMDFNNEKDLKEFVKVHPNKFDIIITDYCVSYFMEDTKWPYFMGALKLDGKFIGGPLAPQAFRLSYCMSDEDFKDCIRSMEDRLFFTNHPILLYCGPRFYWSISKYYPVEANNNYGKLFEVDSISHVDQSVVDNWNKNVNWNINNIKNSLLTAVTVCPKSFSNYELTINDRLEHLNVMEPSYKHALEEFLKILDDNSPCKSKLKTFLNSLNFKNEDTFVQIPADIKREIINHMNAGGTFDLPYFHMKSEFMQTPKERADMLIRSLEKKLKYNIWPSNIATIFRQISEYPVKIEVCQYICDNQNYIKNIVDVLLPEYMGYSPDLGPWIVITPYPKADS